MEVADRDEAVRFLEARLRSLVIWSAVVWRESAGEGVVDEGVDEGGDEIWNVFADSVWVFFFSARHFSLDAGSRAVEEAMTVENNDFILFFKKKNSTCS